MIAAQNNRDLNQGVLHLCQIGPNLVSPAWTGVEVSRGHQGSPFLKIFTFPTSKICFFQYQIIYDLEEKIIQIYLPDGQFYLPRAVGQWDMSSPGHWTWWRTDGQMQATTIPWVENWPRVKKTLKLVLYQTVERVMCYGADKLKMW